MRRGPALVLASCLLGAAALARPLHAQDASADDRSSRHDVALVATGPAEETSLLEETLRELLGRQGLRVVAPDAPKASLLARVEVDLTGVAITVTDARDGSIVARRSLARAGSSAVVCEEAAHAIRAIVAAELLDPVKVAERRKQEPPPAPPAPPPTTPPPVAAKPPEAPPTKEADEPKAPAGYGFDVATFLAGGPFADQKAFVPRFGIGAGLGSRRGLRPSVSLALLYALPFETSGGNVGSHANVVSPRAAVGIELAHASWISLGVQTGGGVDVIAVEPRSAILPSSNLGASTTRVDPILSAAVTAQLPLVPGVVFTTALGADVDLASRTYVLDEGGSRSDVLAPWRVRPQLVLGFAFTALGEATFR